MRTSSSLACVLLLLFSSQGAAQSSPIDELRWLAGCWELEKDGSVVEEQWQEPRGGTLLGMSRTTRGESLAGFEFMRIFTRGDTLVFAAQPSGQAPSEFPGRSGPGREVAFENSEHDFPQRVLYRALGEDSLFARIDGTSGGQVLGVDFRFARTECPA